MAVDVGGTGLRLAGALARRHHGNRACCPYCGAEFLRIAGHVGQGPVRRFGQTLQQRERGCQFVHLARRQQKIDQPPGGISHADDLGAKPTSRPPQRFRPRVGAASESQTQRADLLDRAPAAFWGPAIGRMLDSPLAGRIGNEAELTLAVLVRRHLPMRGTFMSAVWPYRPARSLSR